MGKVEDLEEVGALLGVSESKRAEFKQQSSTKGKESHSLGEYWVKTDPDASWEMLAKILYSTGNETAAAMAKQYLLEGICIIGHSKLTECRPQCSTSYTELDPKLYARVTVYHSPFTSPMVHRRFVYRSPVV